MRIDKGAWSFVVLLGGAALLAWILVHPLLGALPLLLAAFTLWFFRDPERPAPAGADLLLSPADGRIIRAGPADVSVFMNVFDVHVCRSPIAGEVESVQHVPGRFLAAFRDTASQMNERVAIVVGDGRLRVRFVLVAGLVARRIVCRVETGRRLTAGERVGLIRFGSRVDVALPEFSQVLVQLGQRVRAGETALARLPGAAPTSRGI